ncbi:hypothetical protein ACWDHW_47860, partial [Streptomyces melanosporofaciens]
VTVGQYPAHSVKVARPSRIVSAVSSVFPSAALENTIQLCELRRCGAVRQRDGIRLSDRRGQVVPGFDGLGGRQQWPGRAVRCCLDAVRVLAEKLAGHVQNRVSERDRMRFSARAVLYALYLRTKRPEIYAKLGRERV